MGCLALPKEGGRPTEGGETDSSSEEHDGCRFLEVGVVLGWFTGVANVGVGFSKGGRVDGGGDLLRVLRDGGFVAGAG